jgi:hypothetical protein
VSARALDVSLWSHHITSDAACSLAWQTHVLQPDNVCCQQYLLCSHQPDVLVSLCVCVYVCVCVCCVMFDSSFSIAQTTCRSHTLYLSCLGLQEHFRQPHHVHRQQRLRRPHQPGGAVSFGMSGYRETVEMRSCSLSLSVCLSLSVSLSLSFVFRYLSTNRITSIFSDAFSSLPRLRIM